MPDLLTEITRAAEAYYAQAAAFPLTTTDFDDWLAVLPPAYALWTNSPGRSGNLPPHAVLR